MKFSFTINGKRYTEKILKATYGEARIEQIKRECSFIHWNDTPTQIGYGRGPGGLVVKVSG